MRHVCIVCLALFDRAPKSRRRTCGRSCASALAWATNPEKRIAGISESKLRPEAQAILARRNRARWSDPAEHEKLARENRARWAHSGIAHAVSRNIRKAWTADKREEAAARKRVFWAKKNRAERRLLLTAAIEASLRARSKK